MPWFTKGKYQYKIPERISPEIARSRRLNALLERERRYADIPNFTLVRQRLAARETELSRVTKNIINDADRPVKGRQAAGLKAASMAAALSSKLAAYDNADFTNPNVRRAYRELRARQEGLRNVSRPGPDHRSFNPTGKPALTIAGTLARIAGVPNPLTSTSWVPGFLNPNAVFPCIERHVRREVMFANKKAGKGYHTKNVVLNIQECPADG